MDFPISDDVLALRRELLESLYTGTLTATKTVYKENPKTHLMEKTTEVICEDEPCRVTRQVSQPTERNPKIYEEVVAITLRPEIDIPPGSEVDCTFHGDTLHFKQSGSVKKYTAHQTINFVITEEDRNYA